MSPAMPNSSSEPPIRPARFITPTIACVIIRPHLRSSFSCRPTMRRIHQKRDSAKDERRNDAGEFGVNEMRAQRAHHEGAKVQRSGSSPPWNQHKGPRLITREEMERRLWPDRNVNFDHSLDVVVSRLRTVLGDKGQSSRDIATVSRRGYWFMEPGSGGSRDRLA